MAHTDKEENGMSRRSFLKLSAGAGALIFAGSFGFPALSQAEDLVMLPALPYPIDALEPFLSSRTIQFHYGKHHAGYVRKTNEIAAAMKLEKMPLDALVRFAAREPKKEKLFNNAAQVWNHSFYWKCMKPQGGGRPEGEVLEQIKRSFGSYDDFRNQFAEAAAGRFGSGWAWLVIDYSNQMKIISTPNAETPLVFARPALTIDVWEHAYYLDYQNRRGDYIDNFLDHLVNWDFVAENIKKA